MILRSFGFPKSVCSRNLVQVVHFPGCWDGVYATSSNYATHMTHPMDDINGYYIPEGFPKKFIILQFEIVFAAIQTDFLNGWKADTPQAVLDDCQYMNATDENSSKLVEQHRVCITSLVSAVSDDLSNCPPLNKSINVDVAHSCCLETQIVDAINEENIISELPGCNFSWTGDTPKPAYSADQEPNDNLHLVYTLV
ncbi:uncharacterized protein L203_105751 [Cryptococcus depauperatus CBS 7841]|uniref:DUF1996 domain-containing protein n=1 Tax=Cryptococcus depauperatus CBS 7841 TaxID=1295531 RepID=A0AAJ8JY20_9TREE